MGYKANTAEGGSNTTAATTGNTGGVSGDAFAAVTPGAGGAITFSSTQKAHGSLSYAHTPASGVICFMQMNDASSSLSFSVRTYVYLTGYPSSETIFINVQTVAGATVGRLHLTTTGALKVVNSAGAASATFTNVMSLNTLYRISLTGTVNATTGTMTAKLYAGDSATPIETQAPTGVNTGSTAAGRVIYGKFTATGTMTVHYFDDIAQDMESAVEIGPVQQPHPPAITRLAVTRAATY